MTKRDDDSQTDMEVGMTTAERRRRRRRGGLRVPSDNVPRRSSTPPVVAPVPEDPGLAMSVAFSFTAESSEPVTRTPRDSAPSFEHHEGVPTVIDPVMDPVIDPVSGPVEQADFDMLKTREMSAVDLEELGLADLAPGGFAMGRATLRDLEPVAMPAAPDGETGVIQHELTDPDAVEVDLDASGVEMDAVVDAGMTLDPDGDGRARRVPDADLELDSAEPTGIHPGPPAPPVELAARAETSQSRLMPAVHAVPAGPMTSEASGPRTAALASHELSGPRASPSAPGAGEAPYPRPVGHEASGPRQAVGAMPNPPVTAPIGGVRVNRAQTFALTEEDLEEVREAAARLATQSATPPPPAQTHPSPPSLSLPPLGNGPPSYPSLPTTQPPSRPASTSMPPPMPPAKATRPRITAQMGIPSVLVTPPIPTVEVRPVDGKAEAAAEFEVDVDGIVDAKPVESTSLEGKPAEPAPAMLPAMLPPVSPSISSPSSPAPVSPLSSPPVPPLVSHPATPPSIPPPRESQSMGIQRGDAPAVAPPSIPPPRESQSMGIQRGDAPAVAPPAIPPPRESQSMGIQRGDAPAAAPPAIPPPRESQPMAALRDGVHPPPTPKAPPAPPPAKKDRSTPAAVTPLARSESRDARELRDARDSKPRGKPWFVDLFDEDYLRTLPFLTPQATQAEAEFVSNALGLQPGAQVLDVGCGYGRHAMELAARGFHIVGLDLSTPLLVRGGEEAHRRGLTINFVRGDMRELDFESQFDGAYCLFSTFGYFDDETNKKAIANMARALRPGGRLLIEILNRDYVIADLPTRVWWEGDGCVVLEEVELNYFSSRIQVNRSVVFDDGRQLEQEISVRAYSLHEVGKLMHSAGLRVLEVSGAYHTRGRFFGNQSRHIIVLAERKDPAAG